MTNSGRLKGQISGKGSYYHPVRGVLFTIGVVLLFMAFLIGVAALIWWIM